MGQFEQVMAQLEAGEDPDAIERELMETAPWLEPEERDALWLFAWSYRARGQRPLAGRGGRLPAGLV